MKKGNNFVAVEVGGRYFFAPSKFVGYLNNNMKTHLGLRDKERTGIETDRVIKNIMGMYQKQNMPIDKIFVKFCEENGFRPFENRKRDYWVIHISPDIKFL